VVRFQLSLHAHESEYQNHYEDNQHYQPRGRNEIVDEQEETTDDEEYPYSSVIFWRVSTIRENQLVSKGHNKKGFNQMIPLGSKPMVMRLIVTMPTNNM